MVVPPNQYVNLIFPLACSSYDRNNRKIDTPQIEGVSTQNTVLIYPPNTRLVGIRFYSFGLFPFIQVQGKDILNSSLNLISRDEISFKISSISANESYSEIIDKVYAILGELFSENHYSKISPIMNFYNEFRWNDETQSIEEYCRGINTNYTSLNRSFKKITGISPKKFERLIKFRKSLCSLIDTNDALTSIGINSGYFDQAHFIREFKLFLKETPSNYKKMLSEPDDDSKIINYNFKLF